MKLPQTPPTTAKLFENLPPKRFQAVIQLGQGLSFQDRYLHWNDLRRRPAPEGFTHHEWWLALKMTRAARLRPIPLLDKSERFFSLGIPDTLLAQLHEMDRKLGFSVDVPDAITRPETRDQYIVSTLIQESITSSQLEGAATTREVAKEMLRTQRAPRDKSERMILNNYRTMQRIRDLRTSALTPELVFELQQRVTEGTLEKPDAADRFRRDDENIRVEDMEGVVFHVPPAAGELPARLQAMCDFANGKTPAFFVHPVIRAIILHFWLAYDHPFVDGNGRTARALFYWSMLREGYQLFEFISISQILLRAPSRYAEAFLHTETDENDLTYFILHQAGVIRDAVQALHEYARAKTADLRSAEQCLRGLDGLNHRQQALMAHALREPNARYIIQGHRQSHSVSFQTARDDLFDLVERGLLTVSKEGRTNIFRIPSDLGGKLSQLAVRHAPQADADNTIPLPLKSNPH